MGGFAGGTRVDETGDVTFERMLDFNFRAAFFMARTVLPPMRIEGGGCILAVASQQAVEPAANVGAYRASKVAKVSMTRTIALESRDRSISADTVLPGSMDTPRNRAGDPQADRSPWVQPSRVAALLVHLASDAGAQVTSVAIPICCKQV
jgi:NAD(P)-dependent dehydrogenase (short-subunit alcohol dehydrogenase family)